MSFIKFDTNFVDTYHQRLKAMANAVVNDLAKKEPTGKVKKVGTLLSVIKYSDMNGVWYNSEWFNSRSVGLQALANKVAYMLEKGRGDSILPMLESIANNNIKKLYHPYSEYSIKIAKEFEDNPQKRESLGKGHFRWDFKAITLSLEDVR